ncbi:uncharacterized protein LOC132046735 isoform X1 [Lycium ferocissimum]|uniref:uncharacterized protein LOC132046735 isoform X1 n=2 Tax=Lycium ferocissimum TaxID=112874 RepID=UPI002815C4A2|nr:uncharacterized protein LOC132046735 isoform X1 [Lycium ferocissimum]
MNLSPLYNIISPSLPKHRHYVISRRVSPSSPPRRRHLRRRLLKKFSREVSSPPSDENLHFILTVDSLPTKSFLHSKLGEFVHSSRAAIEDLQTLIRIDSNNGRVFFSCTRSTVKFLATLLLTTSILIFTLRAIFKLLLGLRLNNPNNNVELVYKRDRSLGGRQVLVARNGTVADRNKPNVLDNNSDWGSRIRFSRRRNKKSSVEQLPKWWPVSTAGSEQVGAENQQEYQRMANRLIRAILDNRMTGKDILADDIIQLRRIGRISDVKVSFDTENARDTLYRVAIDFVLNYCESIASQSAFVLIDGEEAQNFVAGLAVNVGLESTQAARMVSAAVAARTRSRFLQAWALEIQGKHSEAVVELSKVCAIHQIFPPEEFSPEMEMVARGLEKHLKVDQREFLMNSLLRVCGDGTRRSVAEALGLMYLKDNIVHQEENKYT